MRALIADGYSCPRLAVLHDDLELAPGSRPRVQRGIGRQLGYAQDRLIGDGAAFQRPPDETPRLCHLLMAARKDAPPCLRHHSLFSCRGRFVAWRSTGRIAVWRCPGQPGGPADAVEAFAAVLAGYSTDAAGDTFGAPLDLAALSTAFAQAKRGLPGMPVHRSDQQPSRAASPRAGRVRRPGGGQAGAGVHAVRRGPPRGGEHPAQAG